MDVCSSFGLRPNLKDTRTHLNPNINFRFGSSGLCWGGWQLNDFLSLCTNWCEIVQSQIFVLFQNSLRALTEADRELVCIADKHFWPGRSIYIETTRCLEECAVFVAVMSRNYCNSDYCKHEIKEARSMGNPIILMFIEDVEPNHMDVVIWEIVRNFTRVKFIFEDGEYKIQPNWNEVCRSIIQMIW